MLPLDKRTGILPIQMRTTPEYEMYVARNETHPYVQESLSRQLQDLIGRTLADRRAYVVKFFGMEKRSPQPHTWEREYTYTLSALCVLVNAYQAEVGEYVWSLPDMDAGEYYKSGKAAVLCAWCDPRIQFHVERFHIQGNDFLVWKRTV